MRRLDIAILLCAVLVGPSFAQNAGPSSFPDRLAEVRRLQSAVARYPDSIQLWDTLARAAFELGGPVGDDAAQAGLEELLAQQPAAYPDAWDRWLVLYRARDDRERMIRILRRHPEHPQASLRTARMLIELDRHGEANQLLETAIARDAGNAALLALRAQSAFETADTVGGAAFYDRALAHAADDATPLWQQIIGIATPEEIRAWDRGIAPAARAAWLRAFWARRTPNLFAGANVRVAEHFRRFKEARQRWPLQQPLTSWQRRAEARMLNVRPGPAEEAYAGRCGTTGTPIGARRVRSESPYARVGDVRDIDSAAVPVGYNLRTGLDDRGLAYLRYGEPQHLQIGSTSVDPRCLNFEVELWTWDEVGTVRFFNPASVHLDGAFGRSTGGIVARPMSPAQFEATAAVLTTDATSVPAPLEFGVWFAQFAGQGGATDVVAITTRGIVAAELVAADSGVTAEARDSNGTAVLAVHPGRYTALVHALVGDTLGRQALNLRVRPMGRGMSDLLLAPAWPDTSVTRAEMLRSVSRDLVVRAGATLRVYAEVYGLTPQDGRARYRATYTIRRGDDSVTLSYDRDRPASGSSALEWLDITPDRLRSGEYELRLQIEDRTSLIRFRIS